MEEMYKNIYLCTFFYGMAEFICKLHFSRMAIIQINKRKGKSRGCHLI
jgi:hypothetical protein